MGRWRAASRKPFKILGNLYFVGDAEGSGLLLTSPEGHILFGTGWVENAESIQKNIESLGFKLTDIKVILLNHFHGDETGGAAYFKEKTGAQMMASSSEIPFIERRNAPSTAPGTDGGEGKQRGGAVIPPVKVDRALSEGEVVRVGPLSVTTYVVPGHTAASTSWLFTVTDGGRNYRAFSSAAGNRIGPLASRKYLPRISATALLSMRHPCDILSDCGERCFPSTFTLKTTSMHGAGF